MAENSNQGVTRRQVVQAVGAGIAGLVVGAVGGGYAVGQGAGTQQAGTAAPGAAKPSIKLGASIPLSGTYAAAGQEYLRGLQLGVDDVNGHGGVAGANIEIVQFDVEDPFDPNKVKNSYERLAAEKVAAIVIPFTSVTDAWEINVRTQIPLFHISTFETGLKIVRAEPEKYWMIFQLDPSEIWYGKGDAELVNRLSQGGVWTPPNKKAAIVTSDNPYGITVAENFRDSIKGYGWDVSLYEQVVVPITEWGPILTKVRSDPPAVLYVTDYISADIAALTQQFLTNPTPTLLYLQYAGGYPEFLKLTGDQGNGVLWSAIQATLPDNRGNALKDTYRKKFNAEPDATSSGIMYDIVHYWSAAVAMVGDAYNTKAVCDQIKRSTHRGVTGSFSIKVDDNSVPSYPAGTPDLSLGSPFLGFQIKTGGQQVIFSPEPFLTGKFELPPWFKA